ncbi:MAG TPA: glucose-6-phosphate dehydrogenase, partial [Terriglobales bacterium]
MVIFGGAGDLTKRKLMPALCNLAEQGFAPQQFAVVIVSSTAFTTETFRQRLTEDIKTFASRPIDPTIRERLVEHTYYVGGDFADPGVYQRLKATLGEVAARDNVFSNHFYYLAVAPRFFGEIVRQLGEAGLAQEENGLWRRVVIEKPFGRDMQSARALNAEIKQVLDEHQIYRIDHYLGKETVQNLIMFRFGNGIFEP